MSLYLSIIIGLHEHRLQHCRLLSFVGFARCQQCAVSFMRLIEHSYNTVFRVFDYVNM